jgi:Ca2+/Na+ antiporter
MPKPKNCKKSLNSLKAKKMNPKILFFLLLIGSIVFVSVAYYFLNVFGLLVILAVIFGVFIVKSLEANSKTATTTTTNHTNKTEIEKQNNEDSEGDGLMGMDEGDIMFPPENMDE